VVLEQRAGQQTHGTCLAAAQEWRYSSVELATLRRPAGPDRTKARRHRDLALS
jgi:hypothetical protein